MDMMTVQEAATELGISDRAVRWRISQGLIAGTRVGAWMWLIPRTEVERVRSNAPKIGRPKRPPTAAPGPEEP